MQPSVILPNSDFMTLRFRREYAEHASFSGVIIDSMIQDAVAAALNEANATIATQQATLKENERVYGEALKVIDQQGAKLREAAGQIREKDAELERAYARIEELQKPAPPVIVEPEPPNPAPEQPGFNPVISKTEFRNLVIGSIVKQDDAGTEEDMMRACIDEAIEVGCTSITAWFHPSEAAGYVKPENINNPLKNIFKYAADRGIIIGADTVDAALRILPETITDDAFNKYIDNLISLGAKYLLWNDVDGVLDGFETIPAQRVYTPEAIKTGMARINRALKEHPTVPVIASLTAGANLEEFRQYGFHFIEIQTFGSLDELKGFVKLNADALCIDVQQSQSLAYLKEARAILVASDATVIRLYAIFDGDTDFRRDKMATRVAEIKETNRQFKETRKVSA